MKKIISLTLLLLILLSAGACSRTEDNENIPVMRSAEAGELTILFINAGKADAILLSTDGKTYLVDTGEKSSVPAILGALNYLGVRTLDGVFLTHTHSDHTGGLELLAASIPIATLYHAEFTELTKKGVNKFERFSQELDIPHETLTAGETLTLDDGITADVIAPIVPNTDDDNDQSLVLMINAGGRKALLTGDMQFAEETTLLAGDYPLSADILKVGNHGNPDATSNAFAKAVSPSIAVITTDTTVDTDSANPRVIDALRGADIYVTQDYPIGVLVGIAPEGEINLFSSDPSTSAAVSLLSIDTASQTVTLQNSGPEADISGYMLFSDKGNELFVFPDGAVIPVNGTLTVACEGGSGDLIWPGEDEVWNSKKTDVGILYDRFGQELDRKEAK